MNGPYFLVMFMFLVANDKTLQVNANEIIQIISNLCILDENCNKEFFALNNYCCLNKGQCCHMFDYIFKNGNVWDNFLHTLKNPRLINIILVVVAILLLCATISFILILYKRICSDYTRVKN